jgi:hypothetical protein
MKNIKVTGCFECPFFHPTDYSDNEPMHCWITDEEETYKARMARWRKPRTPTFLPNCPLKEGKVVAEIKTQKKENKNG